ncbi:unnamed protein product [Didymodactylos carnosus]|uniref:U2A'/phosphoprotein 32 family A C-terminal domain-containing protein n=1 Tax=Didymodactylos carnosus TaxID=1234261 RepID=A0A8S2NKV9_9BILA|nr:unnamed protein product [Didymodactylos carnosus]CAF4006130.1 unnamed protein product [Didymodactylos carnosus]
MSGYCDCSAQQKQWFLFDNSHAYAEYVIEFEYLFSISTSTLIDQLSRIKPDTINNILTYDDPIYNDEISKDISVLPHDDEFLPKINGNEQLTEDFLLKLTNQSNIINITELNLHGCHLTSIKQLHNLKNLRTLNISFNELSKIDELNYFYALESIDVSYNKVTTFDGIKGLTQMTTLIASYNHLTKSVEEIQILKRYFPSVQHLDLRGNPFEKTDHLRSRTLAVLPTLMSIDGTYVTAAEREVARKCLPDIACSHENVAKHSRTYIYRPRDLRCHSIAKYYDVHSTDIFNVHQPSTDDPYWMSKVTSLCLDNVCLSKLPNLSNMICLKWASFNNNCLTKLRGLEQSIKLEELSVENNFLTLLEGIENLSNLRKLNISKNEITEFDGQILSNLTRLSYLSMDQNRFHSLAKLGRCTSLIELYAGNNLIKNIRDIFYLKPLPNLLILDLWGNLICHEAEKYRLFVIYHLKSLRAFDGYAVEIQESGEARETFGGKLTADFIVEKMGHTSLNDLKQLELPQCAIRGVDLGQSFLSLKCINLEHNQLTNFSGLIYLINLKVLCLNYNRIESILPRVNKSKVDSKGKPILEATDTRTVLENLEVLHLAYNNISDVVSLQLSKIPSLRSLFLQGNEISKVEGLESLRNLRELVLDKNKIRVITETSFFFQTNLIELHLEENRIRELSYFDRMSKLEKLFLGSNKIQELTEVEKLINLVGLSELSLMNNPISRKSTYRLFIVYRLPQVQILDEVLITEDERYRSEVYYTESQVMGGPTVNVTEIFPGLLPGGPLLPSSIQQQQPIRINQMNINENFSNPSLIEQIRQRQMQLKLAASFNTTGNGKTGNYPRYPPNDRS